MESDGLEDTLLGAWQLYEALDELEDMVALLAGMIATMKVDKERLAERTRSGWAQATDLAAMLTREAGISWRDAHQVLARLVREAIDAGRNQQDVTPADIDRVAGSVLGRTLGVSQEAVRSAVDPRPPRPTRSSSDPADRSMSARCWACRPACTPQHWPALRSCSSRRIAKGEYMPSSTTGTNMSESAATRLPVDLASLAGSWWSAKELRRRRREFARWL
jgi:hypothetical protein